MSRKLSRPQTRRHVFIFDEDWAYLDSVYGVDSPSQLGVSHVIRTVVQKFVNGLKARANERLDQQTFDSELDSQIPEQESKSP